MTTDKESKPTAIDA